MFFHSYSKIVNIITVKIILLWRTYHLYYSVIVCYLFYCSKFYNCFWCKYILLLALFLFYCITYEELLMSSNMSLEKTLYFKSSLNNKTIFKFSSTFTSKSMAICNSFDSSQGWTSDSLKKATVSTTLNYTTFIIITNK